MEKGGKIDPSSRQLFGNIQKSLKKFTEKAIPNSPTKQTTSSKMPSRTSSPTFGKSGIRPTFAEIKQAQAMQKKLLTILPASVHVPTLSTRSRWKLFAR